MFSPRLVEVINIETNKVCDSYDFDDYWQAWAFVDDLVDKIGLDDFSYMVSKVE